MITYQKLSEERLNTFIEIRIRRRRADHASDMGVLLYTRFGFKKNGNFMQYNL